jgi:N-carbamoyl-L-amino-acid hydrolase
MTDESGASLEDVRRQAGMTGDLREVQLPGGYYKAFVELHIEQGPVLERERVALGVVEKIAAPASLHMIVEGAGGHAGAVLMPDRRDALCAAAELILAIEAAAQTSGAIDSVATVGICDVFPGAINSIPARVRLGVDIRDTSLPRRDGVMRAVEEASRRTAGKRRVAIHTQLLNADAPADCGPGIIQALSEACKKHLFSFLPMTSRAYHDSLFISRIAPVAMLFIPCRNGYSHRPDEYASPEDIARGTLVLAETLATLAG